MEYKLMCPNKWFDSSYVDGLEWHQKYLLHIFMRQNPSWRKYGLLRLGVQGCASSHGLFKLHLSVSTSVGTWMDGKA